MIRLPKWVLVVLALALVVGTAAAAETAKGKIKSVTADKQEFVLTDTAGKDWTFHMDPKATVRLNDNRNREGSKGASPEAILGEGTLEPSGRNGTGIRSPPGEPGPGSAPGSQLVSGPEARPGRREPGRSTRRRRRGVTPGAGSPSVGTSPRVPPALRQLHYTAAADGPREGRSEIELAHVPHQRKKASCAIQQIDAYSR
jgi:hypothetical protein